jgi:two-component system, sensor histidine kinase and response regulator
MIHVLLIEDSPSDAKGIQEALLGSGTHSYLEGFKFSSAGSLAESLTILKSSKVDVVLLDLGLPDTRGYEGVDTIKHIAPLTPIIVLTGQAEETLFAIEAVKRGAEDYFYKGDLPDAFSLDRVIRYAIERKKNESALITAREEALKASRAKSDFLSNMSHDIRTPLNCIIGVADILSRSKLPEEETHCVQMLNRACDNLLMLINNILDISKIESGQFKIDKAPFDLLENVESLIDMVSTRAHAKGLELVFKIDPSVPRRLIGDAARLNQILTNLLGNAIKFTKTGEVVMAIKTINSDDGRPSFLFSVKDSGVGIAKDKIPVIFETFTQLDHKDLSLKRQGSGLGLSICRKLTELMGGKISVTSEVNQGSEFTVVLPFDLPPKVSCEQTVPPLSLENVSVLVVDDNRAHAAVLSELLVYWGAKVKVAYSSNEALAIVKSFESSNEKFAIGLFDLRMPGLAAGGFELAEALKMKVESIILMVPSNHRHGDLERIKLAEGISYLAKPAKPGALSEMMVDCLKKNQKAKLQTLGSQHSNLDLKPFSILVADDSEENRELIEAYCKNTVGRIELAEDGKDALSKFKENHFNLVLMDIQMPGMNGYEALSAIRAWEKSMDRKGTPIVALTAFALHEEAEKCLSAGFKAHVTKPIRRNDLLHVIKKFAA